MSLLTRGLSTLAVLGCVGVIASAMARPAFGRGDNDFEIKCGPDTTDAMGAVLVHIVPKGGLQHGRLILASAFLMQKKLQEGEIVVAINVRNVRSMCGAIAPASFQVRGTSDQLNATTLRVSSTKPVRVEIRDSAENVISTAIADPNAKKLVGLVW